MPLLAAQGASTTTASHTLSASLVILAGALRDGGAGGGPPPATPAATSAAQIVPPAGRAGAPPSLPPAPPGSAIPRPFSCLVPLAALAFRTRQRLFNDIGQSPSPPSFPTTGASRRQSAAVGWRRSGICCRVLAGTAAAVKTDRSAAACRGQRLSTRHRVRCALARRHHLNLVTLRARLSSSRATRFGRRLQAGSGHRGSAQGNSALARARLVADARMPLAAPSASGPRSCS